MKRYSYPSRPQKLSKSTLGRKLKKALATIESTSRENADLRIKLSSTKYRLHTAETAIHQLSRQLEKVTEKVWDHFQVYGGPVDPFSKSNLWQFQGSTQISFGVDFNEVRMMAMKNKQDWIELIADQFASKARECALKNLRIIDA